MEYPNILDNLRLFLDALRFLRDAYKTLRPRKQPNAEETVQREEKVLQEALEKAEEMSAKGVQAKEVFSELETKLETELGQAGKNEILARASSILAMARPLDLGAFRYCEQLMRVLDSACEFCQRSNIFRLKGKLSGEEGSLFLPRLGPVLRKLMHRSGALHAESYTDDTIGVSTKEVAGLLTTKPGHLDLFVIIEAKKAYSMGGTYSENKEYSVSLTSGTEVNRIRFNIIERPQFSCAEGFEIRISGDEFKQMLLAIFEDLDSYASELLAEEKEFRDTIHPALQDILSALQQSK